MFVFEMDPEGILKVQTTGFWTTTDAAAYIGELRQRVDGLRRAQGCALVLVDGRDNEVQSAAVMQAVGDVQSILIVGETDRAAYIVRNSLAKLQARRLSTSKQLDIFLSPSAARTWLLAHRPAELR